MDALSKARQYAHLLLRVKPRSERDIAERLAAKGFDDGIITSVVRQLAAEGAVDDRALARMWVEKRLLGNPRSSSLIKQELVDQGIGEDVADQVLKAEPVDDRAQARRVIDETKKRLTGMSGEKMKKRLFDALLRRGFSEELAEGLLSEL
ncbi:MAG: regulatory protein RecX [Candidatus Omnitrophica bacterium]|nr:regulatory protein RecX [Candidatus Omnitrophota bacterium]